jgi:hypothetical protein
VAKDKAKIFVGSAVAFVQILKCGNCDELLFGGGSTTHIKPIKPPKFCRSAEKQ